MNEEQTSDPRGDVPDAMLEAAIYWNRERAKDADYQANRRDQKRYTANADELEAYISDRRWDRIHCHAYWGKT